jgi:MFS family permease
MVLVEHRSWWSFVISLSNFNLGYFLYEIQQLWDFTPWIYNFEIKHRVLMNTVSGQGTTIVGALTCLITWYFWQIGKRKLLIINNIVLILAWCILMIEAIPALLIGRFLKGVYFGISTWIVPMFIVEISELNQRGGLLAFTQLSIVSGLLAVQIVGLWLPKFVRSSEQVTYWASLDGVHVIWREIFSFPIIVGVLQMVLLIFVFK